MSYTNIIKNLTKTHKNALKSNITNNMNVNQHRKEQERLLVHLKFYRFLKEELLLHGGVPRNNLVKITKEEKEIGNRFKNIFMTYRKLERNENKRRANLMRRMPRVPSASQIKIADNKRQKNLMRSLPPVPRHTPRSVVREKISSPAPRSSPIRKPTFIQSVKRALTPARKNNQKSSLSKRFKKLFYVIRKPNL